MASASALLGTAEDMVEGEKLLVDAIELEKAGEVVGVEKVEVRQGGGVDDSETTLEAGFKPSAPDSCSRSALSRAILCCDSPLVVTLEVPRSSLAARLLPSLGNRPEPLWNCPDADAGPGIDSSSGLDASCTAVALWLIAELPSVGGCPMDRELPWPIPCSSRSAMYQKVVFSTVEDEKPESSTCRQDVSYLQSCSTRQQVRS